jgi:flagellar motility protein MotE (MotC chaperone)
MRKNTQYDDYRGLPVCLVDQNGAILLDDERQGVFASERKSLMKLDWERTIFETTGSRGAVLPKDSQERSKLKQVIRKAIADEAARQAEQLEEENRAMSRMRFET